MNLRTAHRRIPLLLPLLLAACASPQGLPPGDAHLTQSAAPAPDANIPAPVSQNLAVPRPKTGVRTETYSVVVNEVPVHDLLFALARDAKVNVDIHPEIAGRVTLNAIDQTLPQILDRLANQLDLRWEMNGQNYVVRPDSAYLTTYVVDYVNITRDTSGTMGVANEVGTGSSGSNISSTKIVSESTNHFWKRLIENIESLVREQDKYVTRQKCSQIRNSGTHQQAENKASSSGQGSSSASMSNLQTGGKNSPTANVSGSSVSGRGDNTTTGSTSAARTEQAQAAQSCEDLFEAAVVIANPETGTIGVRAKKSQHDRIQQFIDQVASSARRQVLIEATVVEVQLSDEFNQGVDWSVLRNSSTSNGIDLVQTGLPVAGAGLLSFVGRGQTSRGTFASAIRLLEQFGNTKVLSSPKISVLNNQTAVLKVVDNHVYFTIKADSQNVNGAISTQFTTTPNMLPIGLVMTVTPQIARDGDITINVRPSISRIIGVVNDPNPDLAKEGISSGIPIVRAREMESILKVSDGNTAILGGLMEDVSDNSSSAVPWFHNIPVIGALFTQIGRTSKKTELVIFIRPSVIDTTGAAERGKKIGIALPNASFFANDSGPRYQLVPSPSVAGGKAQ